MYLQSSGSNLYVHLSNFMELQKLTSVEVEVVDGSVIQVVAIEKEEGVSAQEIHVKVCHDLELSTTSHKWFALYKGRKKVKKKFRDSDFIPSSSQDLCLRKFCFNQQFEEELIRSDPVACHLLYKEAQLSLTQGEVHPTEEQREKLKEYSTDGFINERLYLNVCHGVKGYFSLRVDDCLIAHNVKSTAPCSPSQTIVSVEGITFCLEAQTNHIPWYCVTRWSMYPSHCQLRFDYQSKTEGAVFVQTDQADYLLMGTVEYVREAQACDPEHPPFFSSMINSTEDGQVTYENALFNKDKSSKYDLCLKL